MDDFETIQEQMRAFGIYMPTRPVSIQIRNARTVFENNIRQLLKTSETFQWLPEYDEVVSWLTDNGGKGLYLYGDCGRGKSLLARYVLPTILLAHCSKVVSVYDTTQMNSRLDEVLSRKLITLDDIGDEQVAVCYGNRRHAFAEIMDAAEKYDKLVIVTSNLGCNEIIDTYGKRVLERIIATTRRIEFKGESLRN